MEAKYYYFLWLMFVLFALVILSFSCSSNGIAKKSYCNEEPYLQTITVEKEEIVGNDIELKIKSERTHFFIHFSGF